MAEMTKAKAVKREPTERMVLRQEKVFIVSGTRDLTPEQTKKLEAALKAAGIKDSTAHMAWVEVGVFVGASKDAAIEAHAGKPGTPDAKLGTYKAPTVAAFSGGSRYKAPPKPLAERESIA
jgi:hypothetical protein